MLRAFLIMGLWLAGMGLALPVAAFDMNGREILRYGVYWGPLKAGRATLEYAPAADGAYTLLMRMKDNTVLLDMDSHWRSSGRHLPGQPFTSLRYEAKQKENSYRADKLVEFDHAKKLMTYTNRRDPGDKVEPVAMEGLVRDAISTIYAWRAEGKAALGKAENVVVMGNKRTFTLTRKVATRATATVKGKSADVWSVDIGSLNDDGTPYRDTWTVLLLDDKNLTPVEVIARNKFGTFRAILEE